MLNALGWIIIGITALVFCASMVQSAYDLKIAEMLAWMTLGLVLLFAYLDAKYPYLIFNAQSPQEQVTAGITNLDRVTNDFKNQEHVSVTGVFENGKWITTMQHPGEYEFVTNNKMFDVFVDPGYHISFIKELNETTLVGTNTIRTYTDTQTKQDTGQKKLSLLIKNFEKKQHTTVEGVYHNGNLMLSLDNPGEYTFVAKNGLFDVYISLHDAIIFIKKQ